MPLMNSIHLRRYAMTVLLWTAMSTNAGVNNNKPEKAPHTRRTTYVTPFSAPSIVAEMMINEKAMKDEGG